MAQKVELLNEPEEDLDEADEEYADALAEESAGIDAEEEQAKQPQPRRPMPPSNRPQQRPAPRAPQMRQPMAQPIAEPADENEFEVREVATATQPVLFSKETQSQLEIYGALATILNKLSRIEKNIFG